MKIKNEKGEEIEVFTADEVTAKAKEASEAAAKKAVEEFQAANPDKAKELEELKDKLADAEEALQAAQNGGKSDAQIERLRKERDDAKKVAEDAAKAAKSVDEKLEQFRKEIVGDTKEEMLAKASKGDAELRKKIEFHFDNYRPTATGKKDIEERMMVAIQLTTGARPQPGFFDGKINMGDRGAGGGYRPSEKDKELTPNQKAIGAVLGITDKDRENYKKFEAEMDAKRALGTLPPR